MLPGDWILAACIAAAALLSGWFITFRSTPGRFAVIEADGLKQRISLDQDQILPVMGKMDTSLIYVQSGSVWIAEAPCPFQQCVETGKKSQSGEIIVCVPNRIFIQIEGKTQTPHLDAVTM